MRLFKIPGDANEQPGLGTTVLTVSHLFSFGSLRFYLKTAGTYICSFPLLLDRVGSHMAFQTMHVALLSSR